MTGPRLAFTMALLLFVGLFSPIAVRPQESRKAARIGWLGGNPAGGPHLREAFLQGLRDLGYVEGRDFLIEYRYAGARGERLPALAAELVALKVDLIFASGGTSGALAAKQATQTIPIVFVAASDPVASGLVASVARPGGNVTGLSSLFSTDLVTKGMELLTQAVPKIRRVAVLLAPGDMAPQQAKAMRRAAEGAARSLGVRIHFVEARGTDDLARAFSKITRARADAVTVVGSRIFFEERGRLADLAAKSRLPAVYSWRESVEPGASCPMDPACLIYIGAPRRTWTRF
jgi:putative ABC transport system substrate-binding protein